MTFIHPDEREGIIRSASVLGGWICRWQVERVIHSRYWSRQIYLHNQQLALKAGQLQAERLIKRAQRRSGQLPVQYHRHRGAWREETTNLAGSESDHQGLPNKKKKGWSELKVAGKSLPSQED